MKKDKIIAIVGKSGSGKTTIVRTLQEETDFTQEIVSCVTREKREGEIEGVDYYFLTNEEFNKRKENGEFAEATSHYGNQYGIMHSEIKRIIANGKMPLAIIDKTGVNILKNNYDILDIEIIQDEESIRERLELRGDSLEDIDKRIEADKEIDTSCQFQVEGFFSNWRILADLIKKEY